MVLTATRRRGWPVALVLILSMLLPLLIPLTARADASDAVAPISDGTGGPTSLGGPPLSTNMPDALATVDLATGTARTSYPFQLPTPRGDGKVSLGLVYNSMTGPGFAGIGWTLAGVPSIVRKGTSGMPSFKDEVFTDTPDELTANTTADEYMSEGLRLIPICKLAAAVSDFGPACSGALEGEAFDQSLVGAVYFRTEVDNGMRYFFLPGGHTWRVENKAGHIFYLGHPLDSLAAPLGDGLEYDGTFSRNIYRWNLVRDLDPAGNTIYFAWDDMLSLLPRDSVTPGIQFLTDIYDTPAPGQQVQPAAFAHRTHLTWELTSSQAAGPLVSPIWRAVPFARLSRVEVTSAAMASSSAPRSLVRSYRLRYVLNDWNTRYYLSSVELHGTCGSNADDDPVYEPDAFTAQCAQLSSTSYDYWQVSGSGSIALPNIVPSALPPIGVTRGTHTIPSGMLSISSALIDIDGDSAADWIEGPFGAPTATVPGALFDGTMFSSGAFVANMSSANPPSLVAGPADIAPGSPQLVYGDWLNNGGITWLWVNPTSSTQRATEVYSIVPPSTSSSRGYSIVGAPFASFTSEAPFDLVGHTVDLDGDGLPDITLQSGADTDVYSSYISQRGRDGSTLPFSVKTVGCRTSAMDPKTYGDDTFRSFADMDGDGTADLVLVNRQPNSPLLDVHVLPSNGHGSFGGPIFSLSCAGSGAVEGPPSPITIGDPLGPDRLDQSIVRMGDVNGDGLADIAILSPSHGLDVCLRYGQYVDELQWGCANESPAALGWPANVSVDMSQSALSFADLDGTGIDQIAFSTPVGGNQAVALVDHSKPIGLLHDITTSAGATTSITYSNVKAMGKVLPVPMWAATLITSANGLAGGQRRAIGSTYDYQDPIYDARDRQFVGFKTVSETVPGGDGGGPGLTTTTTFATDTCPISDGVNPCIGNPDYAGYRSSRGVPVFVEEKEAAGGTRLRSTWNEYRAGEVTYSGMDGRTTASLGLYRRHTFMWNPKQQAGSMQSVDVLALLDNPPTVQAFLPTSAPEILREFSRDGFGNVRTVVDFGVVGVDQPIAVSRDWQPVATTVGVGWAFRIQDEQTSYVNAADATTPAGPVRSYFYGYESTGHVQAIDGILSGELPLSRSNPVGPVAPLPPDASSVMAPGVGVRVSVAQFQYDSFGNLTQVSRPNGRCSSITYDPVFSQLPIESSSYLNGCGNAPSNLPMTVDRSWNRGLERVTVETAPFSGTAENPAVPPQRRVSKYDNFGRVIEVDQPDDSIVGMTAPDPAVLVHYQDAGPVRSVHIQTVDGGPAAVGPVKYADHYRFLDGFGQTIAALDRSGTDLDGRRYLVSGVHTNYVTGLTAHVYPSFHVTVSGDPAAFPADSFPYAGPTRTFTYDGLGRILTATDFLGNVTTTTYGALSTTVGKPLTGRLMAFASGCATLSGR